MNTSTVDVSDMLTPLNAAGVARQLAKLRGVRRADVNYVAGSATVHFDERQISLAKIERAVRDGGFHCRGEMLPKHVCDVSAPQSGPPAGARMHDHAAAAGGAAAPVQPPARAHGHGAHDMMHDRLVGIERSVSALISRLLNDYRELRDTASEELFNALYGNAEK